ncbi:MAG: class I SAM-dependent methyltransferase [Cyanobium sp.]
MTIHETSPSNNFIGSQASSYSCSQYFPDIKPGAIGPNGIRCENMEMLSFDDDTYDIFVSQDVLEHVFHPAQAVKETLRILRPGGIHVFTAPMFASVEKSIQCAELLPSGEINYLMPPDYHQNPVGDGKSLVTWLYGLDFPSLLSQWSKASVAVYKTRDRSLGIDSEIDEVFVMQKPPRKEPSQPRTA